MAKRKKDKEAVPDDLLFIDKHNLDNEWIEQPKLFNRFSVAAADAKRKRDKAYAELKIVTSETYLDVRTNPSDYDLEGKPTEGMVNNAVGCSDAVKDAQRDHRTAQYQYDILQGSCEALNQRCKALENLVKLHGQDYFSEPRIRKDDKEAVEELNKRKARKPLTRTKK